MAGKSSIADETKAFCRDRRRVGLSHRAIVEELKARGTPLSLGTVQGIVPAGSKPPASPVAAPPETPVAKVRPRAPKAADAPKATPEPLEAPPLPPDDADMATLDRWLGSTQLLCDFAEKEKNLSAFASLQKLMQATLDRKRKMRPPPAPDESASPDMVAMGQAAKARLHKYIDEALRAAGDGK